jgi:hypothetical protein
MSVPLGNVRKGSERASNGKLEEGFSSSNNSNSNNDSRADGRQEQAAEFGEEVSWLRQEC